MIVYILGITGLIFNILLPVLLVIGLIYSKINSFKPGFYFFLLLIIHEVYSSVSPFFTRNYIDNIAEGHKEPFMGMTIGEFFVFLSLIPEVLLFTAFLFLITGIRSFRNTKYAFQK